MIQPEARVAPAVPITPAAAPAAVPGLSKVLTQRKSRKRLRTGERVFLWVSRLIILVFLCLTLIPILWVISTSFSAGGFFSQTIIPAHFTLTNYANLFNGQVAFPTWVKNSVILCTTVGGLTVVLVATMAYAFSRFRFFGRKYGLMALLIVQMFPAQMSFVAFKLLLEHVHMDGTLIGLMLVLIGGGLPFNAWLFKGYIDSLPVDLEEAAYVDGASKLQAYLRIILPLTRPMMAVVFLFSWFGMFSEYLLSNYILGSNANAYTVAVGLRGFVVSSLQANYPEFAAAAVLGSIPLMIVFLSAQRFLVAGLSRGAVKG